MSESSGTVLRLRTGAADPEVGRVLTLAVFWRELGADFVVLGGS